MHIQTDCRHFQGDRPCRPHKDFGVHCAGCPHYDAVGERILIIKLGAVGDVIRTTPILRKLKETFPSSYIHWLTHTPEVLPALVDRTHIFGLQDVEILKATQFDILFNLDKDREACALANAIHAKTKHGFLLAEGHCAPADDTAKQKWITGLFDDENMRNAKSYPQEIFEMCGFAYNGEEYVLDVQEHAQWDLPEGKKIIGLNTGCGERWSSRLWPEAHWVRLAKLLKKEGYGVLFLGGEKEDGKNERMAQISGVRYPGHFRLPLFMDLVDGCDLIVTAVTMALHIALGLKKKVVLLNNVFNPREFEFFERGRIVEPPKDCKGCYKNVCEQPCMELIQPEDVFSNIQILLR
ncbi:MAG: glycosyltransferase family 9 protein [bacterium]